MMSFFLSPWVMLAGAALAVSPIIIHLINRMRFRRVRWAAMEFLLKAQKKMRRKKILEQLILLLLRILLILLAGLLLARFLGEDPTQGKETRPVLHLVILDDSPSMADTGEGGGAAGNDAFKRAKEQITDKIMVAATKASTPQGLRIIRTSDLADVLNTGDDKAAELINPKLIDAAKGKLAELKPTNLHAGIPPALKKAKELIQKPTDGEVAKVVHVVSDMRSVDWTRDAEAIAGAVKELTDLGAKVHLIDVASPNRKPDRKNPAYSDNVAILELKPRNRVAAVDKEVEIEVRVKNYGSTDLKNVLVEFHLNGQPNVITSKGFEVLPANQERTEVVLVTFNTSQGATVATKEDPLARFNVVTATLKNTGVDALAADNSRHAVVEVREKLSVLMVTSKEEFAKIEAAQEDKSLDSFYLRRLFEIKFSGVEVVPGTTESLDKLDLREFSSIYLVNIDKLSESQVKNLERYVRDGGGVGVFLGKAVNAESYNAQFYREGEGLFPFRLPAEPTPAPTDEQRLKKGVFSGSTLAKRILIRDSAARSHPALMGIYNPGGAGADKDTALKVEASFLFVSIDQHWPIARIGRWREDRSIAELYCLPNEELASNFEDRVTKLIAAIKLKYGEPKFEKYRATIDPILDKLRATSAANSEFPLTELARQMDRLLSDQVSEGDATEALIREFWGHPELGEAKATAQALRDSTKYGDPLYVARRFGNGRFAVMTTDAGGSYKDEANKDQRFTDWPSGPGSPGWVAVMTEMQKYLAGGGAEENRVIGSPLAASYESGRYKPEVSWSFLTYDAANPEKGTNKLPAIRDPVAGQAAKTKPLDTKEGALRLNFTDTTRPGVYLFTLTWQKREGDPAAAPATKPEYVAAVFNFDAERESDLKRTNTDDFKAVAKGAEDIHSPDDDSWLSVLEQKPTDLSSGRWIYLFIILVLVLEQAMAVRLSYHQRPDELEAFAPSAAAAMAGRTAPPVAAEETAAAGEGPAA